MTFKALILNISNVCFSTIQFIFGDNSKRDIVGQKNVPFNIFKKFIESNSQLFKIGSFIKSKSRKCLKNYLLSNRFASFEKP